MTARMQFASRTTRPKWDASEVRSAAMDAIRAYGERARLVQILPHA